MTLEDQWHGDVMMRRDYARFLQNTIQSKFESAENNALCIALDAEWGAGKTFFIDNWIADLKNLEYCTIKFDAWRNDHSEDPMIGFVAEVKEQLEPWIKQTPLGPQIKEKLLAQTKTTIKQAGKAIAPALKSIAIRYIGSEAVSELSQISGKEASTTSDEQAAYLPTNKEIEAYLETALKQHSIRSNAISKLKEELESLAKTLEELAKINLPIYIFVDELDRCRPTYAIRLLEGMKHIFNARGICFIVATNMHQLGESIKSQYGNGFNANLYLKRFFEIIYRLPEPNLKQFSKLLFKDHADVRPYPARFNTEINSAKADPISESDAFAVISSSFSLDLRSQKQVYEVYRAAAYSIAQVAQVHFTYLLFLCALIHTHPTVYEELVSGAIDMKTAIAESKFKSITLVTTGRNRGEHSLTSLLIWYHDNAQKTAQQILDRLNQQTSEFQFPDTILEALLPQQFNRSDRPAIHKYASVVKMAGRLV